jgi:hypothetical protein
MAGETRGQGESRRPVGNSLERHRGFELPIFGLDLSKFSLLIAVQVRSIATRTTIKAPQAFP